MPAPFDPHLILHAAAFASVAALALRDQLKLRAVLLVSILLSALYNDLKSPPSYQEMVWNGVTLAINLAVIVQIVLDRTHVGLSDEDTELFSAFEMLTPGEFRAIVRLATWGTAESALVVTREGERPDALYYVLRGGIVVAKAGRSFGVDSQTFIGEIAFLHDTPASATVTLEPGARFLFWPSARLRAHLEGRETLKNAVSRLISFDMATKIARS